MPSTSMMTTPPGPSLPRGDPLAPRPCLPPLRCNRRALRPPRQGPPSGLWKCKDCRRQFSVTVGTVVELNHTRGEYARGNVTTNTVEGYFSIFKRGMKGVYHHCDEAHLHRYFVEFDFRYN